MRELAEARNHGETLVYTTEKTLKEHADALEEEARSTIEARIAELKESLAGDDVAAIRAKSDALTEAAHTLAQAVYERVQAQQQASAPSSGNGGGEDEVVEEAEYEVVDEEARKE
jgi:molecular chaperone DnaK